LFRAILSQALPDCTFDMAGDGEEAVRAFSEGHHRVLLMDLHMPVMDGQSAFFQIRDLCADRRWEMPSVVFCTGFVPPDTVQAIVAENPTHCLLQKPLSDETLTGAIRKRLRA
jgi:CheY-like chemotaxis protein